MDNFSGNNNQEESNIGVGFSSKTGLSKEELIMEAWRDVRNKRAQEMKRGYFNTKFDKYGNAQRIWIPDAREQYINSVLAFDLLLTADWDEDYIEKRKTILSEMGTAFKKWGWKLFDFKKVKIEDTYNGFKYLKKYNGKIVMPEQDSKVYDINSEGKSIYIDWNPNLHNYSQELVLIYDKLTGEITKLLQRLKYFKTSARYN